MDYINMILIPLIEFGKNRASSWPLALANTTTPHDCDLFAGVEQSQVLLDTPVSVDGQETWADTIGGCVTGVRGEDNSFGITFRYRERSTIDNYQPLHEDGQKWNGSLYGELSARSGMKAYHPLVPPSFDKFGMNAYHDLAHPSSSSSSALSTIANAGDENTTCMPDIQSNTKAFCSYSDDDVHSHARSTSPSNDEHDHSSLRQSFQTPTILEKPHRPSAHTLFTPHSTFEHQSAFPATVLPPASKVLLADPQRLCAVGIKVDMRSAARRQREAETLQLRREKRVRFAKLKGREPFVPISLHAFAPDFSDVMVIDHIFPSEYRQYCNDLDIKVAPVYYDTDDEEEAMAKRNRKARALANGRARRRRAACEEPKKTTDTSVSTEEGRSAYKRIPIPSKPKEVKEGLLSAFFRYAKSNSAYIHHGLLTPPSTPPRKRAVAPKGCQVYVPKTQVKVAVKGNGGDKKIRKVTHKPENGISNAGADECARKSSQAQNREQTYTRRTLDPSTIVGVPSTVPQETQDEEWDCRWIVETARTTSQDAN